MSSVTSIVRNVRPRTLNKAFTGIDPNQSYDLELSNRLVAPSIGRSDCDLGERFHQALNRSIHGGWVERQFWPYARVLKDWLKDIGVSQIWSEWEFRSAPVKGCADLLVAGGPNHRGVVEIKLVNKIPEFPAQDDLAQLGMYVCLAAGRFGDYQRYWGGLAYVHPYSRTIRIFEFSSAAPLCQAANTLIASRS